MSAKSKTERAIRNDEVPECMDFSLAWDTMHESWIATVKDENGKLLYDGTAHHPEGALANLIVRLLTALEDDRDPMEERHPTTRDS